MSTHKPCMTNYNKSHIIIIKDQDKNNSDRNMQDLLNCRHDQRKLDPCSCTNYISSTTAESSCSHHKLERHNKYYYFNNNNNNSTASAINSKLKRSAEAKYITKSGSNKNINIISDNNIHDNWNMMMNKSRAGAMSDKKFYMVDKEKLLMQTHDVLEYYSYIGGGAHAPDHHHQASQLVQVCSMCGDVGVAELLFLCTRCSLRHQHIYCSRSYPDMGGEASMCNWCLHEEDSLISSAAKVSEVSKTTARAYTNQMKEINHPAADHANQASSLINELNQDDEDGAEHMQVMVKKGHSKAFEYLLLVAAQSLPLDNQVISDETEPELNQANNTASMINITNQVISEASFELKQAANHTASMVTLANPKILGSLVNKRNIINLDTKVNTGILDNNEVNMGSENKGNINLSNRFSMGLEKNMNLKKQSMDLHNKLNIRLDVEQKIDVGGLIVPKRQRCSKGINPPLKGINPSLKCRKKGFQLSPSRPNYRRYKLLADVVC